MTPPCRLAAAALAACLVLGAVPSTASLATPAGPAEGQAAPVAGGALQAAASPRGLSAPRLQAEVRLDGRLDEPAWERAAIAAGFTQLEPHAGEAARQPTEVRLFLTSRHLFIGARLTDLEASRIVATEYVRDADLEGNDAFEVFLDTFRDRRNAFYFATNPVGARRDGLVRNEGESLNWEWDGVWDVAVSRDASGWTVEMSIPLSTLRFDPGSRQGWGVNFGRLVARTRESSFWVPVDRDWGLTEAKWRVSAWAPLTGVEGAQRLGRVQLKPFLLGGAEQDWEDGTGRLGPTAKPGLDAKIAVTGTLTADVSVNTDFAQVESDQQQINLTRFPLFFPEKREFFLENAGLFQVGERYDVFEPPTTLLFFSRQVGLTEDGDQIPLYGGVRVTGKVGPWDLGLMDIVSKATRIDQETRVADTNIVALRVKRDVLARSTAGAFLFSKSPATEGASNQVFGGDLNLALGDSLKVNAVAARSVTPGLDGPAHLGILSANWTTDRAGAAATYADIGDDFNAELGFLQRTGIRKYRLNTYLGLRPRRAGIRQGFLLGDLTVIDGEAGALETRTASVGSALILEDGGFLVAQWVDDTEGLTETFEIRDGVEVPVGAYRFRQGILMYRGDRGRRLSFNANAVAGGFYGGRLGSWGGGAQLRPHGRLTVNLDLQRNDVDVPVEGGRFSTTLVIARAVLAFSPRAFLRGLYQWNDDDREARANVLLRFTFRPGSDLFVVYNEDRGIRGDRPPVKRRSLLVKVSLLSIPR